MGATRTMNSTADRTSGRVAFFNQPNTSPCMPNRFLNPKTEDDSPLGKRTPISALTNSCNASRSSAELLKALSRITNAFNHLWNVQQLESGAEHDPLTNSSMLKLRGPHARTKDASCSSLAQSIS